MLRALSLLARLPARPGELLARARGLLDRVRRLIDPRRWSAAVRILAELMNGGLLVPAPKETEPLRQDDATRIEIYSLIQPSGDIQLKVNRSLLESDDFEEKLEAHLDEIGEALNRIRDATGQVLLLRTGAALVSFWMMFDSLWELVSGLAEDLVVSARLGPLDWLLIGGGGLLLLVSLVFPKLLGWLVRRRLGSLVRNLKKLETREFGAETSEAS